MTYTKLVNGFRIPLSDEEIAQRVQEEQEAELQASILFADEIRTQRNTLLAASDWTQVADAPVDQAAWAAYRQALREITAQAGFPHNVVWPEKPE